MIRRTIARHDSAELLNKSLSLFAIWKARWINHKIGRDQVFNERASGIKRAIKKQSSWRYRKLLTAYKLLGHLAILGPMDELQTSHLNDEYGNDNDDKPAK